MKKTSLFLAAATLALASGLIAQATKKYPILQPQMKVEGSTYSSPAAKLGEKPAEAWSGTTVAAAVDGKPQAAKVTTLVGEIVDFSCYLQIGKHGDKHRACGQKCLQTGQPIGLLTADGNLYLLMEEEHDPRRDGQTSAFRKKAAEHTAHILEVTGTLASHAGVSALYVTGFVEQ